MRLPQTKTVPITEVHPYAANPRTIPAEAVEGVRKSIADYGYVQPILVDPKGVIIAGHTRYQALLALGVEQVDVLVAEHLTEAQARQYRLVDNRTAELTDWSHEELVAELREWEEALISEHFPKIDLGLASRSEDEVTEADIEAGAIKAATVNQAPEKHMTDVVCPSCEHTFQVKTASLPKALVDEAFPWLLR